MKNFKQHYNLVLEFFDTIDGAVKHIDHLEENILNKGKQGVIEAMNQIESSISYFVDETDYKISTKFDGAPAIVAGVDTSGKFFVASKSAFNKPKEGKPLMINYTNQDIVNNHGSGGLSEKLKEALKYLPSLNMKGIYQMDYMFDSLPNNDETFKPGKEIAVPKLVDGVKNENEFITFKPNTIIYAVTPDSPYGNKISRAKIGVAIHIEYVVQNGILKVKKYASDPSEFSSSNTVFVFNVLSNRPKNAKSSFSKLLLRDVQKKKKRVLALADKIKFSALDDYTALLKTYINTEIRAGRFLDNTAESTTKFIEWIAAKHQKEVNKVVDRRQELIDEIKDLEEGTAKKRKTTQVGKMVKRIEDKKNTKKAAIAELRKLRASIKGVFETTKIIAALKDNLIEVFNELTRNDLLGTYLEEAPNVWQTTAPEGFALSKVDDVGGANITKLVNRAEFSAANFGTGKPNSAPTQVEQPQQQEEEV
jgi:cell division protein FtsB